MSHLARRHGVGGVATSFPPKRSTLLNFGTPVLAYDDGVDIGWNSYRYQGLGLGNPRPFSSTVPKTVSETTVPCSASTSRTTIPATDRQARELEMEMRSSTNQLLDPEQTPFLDDAMWNEAQNILWWWVKQPGHHSKHNSKRNDDFFETEEESVAMCFQILDRLASDLPTNEMLFASILHTDLINAVLLLWRNCVVRRHGLGTTAATATTNMQRRHATISSSTLPNVGSKILLPSNVAEKLDSYRWRSLVQPNTKTYNLILDAAASSYNNKTGVLFAQSLVEKMIQIDKESSSLSPPISSTLEGDDSLGVVIIDVITVGSVIKAWVNSGLPEAPDKAYAWLEWLDSRSNDDQQGSSRHLRPNNKIYTMVMHSYAQVGDAIRAEEILERQLQDYQEGHGNVDAKPNTQTFNTVLLAWSKTRTHRREAPSRAEAILQRMQEAQSSNHDTPHNSSTTCRPDQYSVTSVLACWANSDLPGAAEEAEGILQSFLQEPGDQQDRFVVFLPPVAQLIAYNTVLRAYSQAGNPQRADDMLQQLITLCHPNDNDGDNNMAHVRPDFISFNQVLAGWSKATETHLVARATHRAEALLAQMQALHTMDGWNTQPDASTYSSVLQCWAMSPLEGAADHAERIFREMQQQACHHPEQQRRHHGHRHHLLQPDVVHYNIVLTVWGNAARKWHDTRALARSHALIEEMIQSKVVRPVDRTFRILLHTLAASSVRNKAEKAQTVVDWMTRQGFRPNAQDKKLLHRLLHKRSRNAV
jgi:pentatricopeptide repeat protein